MNVPYIPKRLFKYGIKPLTAGTEKLCIDTPKGLHLAGFDVETIGGKLFRKNDLYSVQIVMDSADNSHIFFPKDQGVKNLSLFFQTIKATRHKDQARKVFATAHNASFDIGALLGEA